MTDSDLDSSFLLRGLESQTSAYENMFCYGTVHKDYNPCMWFYII